MDINAINGLKYNDTQLIDIILEELRDDSRYEAAVTGIVSQLNMVQTYNKQFHTNDFPQDLTLHNIPTTVMSYYTEDEKQTLFPQQYSATVHTMNTPVRSNTSNSTDAMCDAIINRLKSDKSLSRQSIDELCEGCGKAGHAVYQSGCDFCAQLLIARNFLKENPNSASSIIRKYKSHQSQRLANRKSRSTNNQEERNVRKPRYNLRKRNKAKVQQLQDVLTDFLDDDDVDDDESFQDATSENESNSLSGNEE